MKKYSKKALLFIIPLLTFWAGVVFSEDYSYDSLNRLTSIIYNDGQQLTYFYDAVGNRTELKGTTYTVSTTLSTPVATPVFNLPKGKISSFPNPCHIGRGEVVTFVFDQGLGDVTLDIYNIAFKRIFQIPALNINEAAGRATWNGIGSDGTLVTSNLYFVLLHSRTTNTSRKFTLLR